MSCVCVEWRRPVPRRYMDVHLTAMLVVYGGKASHQSASVFWPWHELLKEAAIERSIFKILSGTPLHV